jgi:hypothetical protein
MIMYLCVRDIDLSSFCTFSIDQLAHKYMIILSPGLDNRKGTERGNIDISSTQIHDHSFFWLGK